MLVKPNLFFEGNAVEAIQFYQAVFVTEAQNVVRYGDFPQQPGAPPMNETYAPLIANARISLGNSFFNVCDVLPPAKVTAGDHIRMDLVFTEEDNSSIGQIFAALSEGGIVIKSLEKVFFSPAYGEIKDRFGIEWAVMQM